MCMSDIFCVTNRKLCQEDFLARIERIAACYPAGIILREKDMKPDSYKELAAAVMKVCEQYTIKCILHSFPDVAFSLHADAIHLPLHLLRELSPEQKSCFRVLGASCHSVEDALEAQRKQSEAMMAQLMAMQQQMTQQNQSAAPPAQDNTTPPPDMAAMMEELKALRAQVAAQANTTPANPDGNSEEVEV